MTSDDDPASRALSLIDRWGARLRAPLAVAFATRGAPTVCVRGTPPGAERALFEIGSITKVVTATLLALLAEEGVVALDEPVNDLLPPDVQFRVVGRPITLADLAAHRAGLPRLPPGWLWRSLRHGDDPYAAFGPADVDAAIRATRPRPPGRPRYSNFGAGVLGIALARQLGTSYEDAVLRRVCGPLGMRDTRMTLDDAAAARLVPGHDRRGRVVPHWDVSVLAGAGALRSPVTDVLRLATAQVDPPDGALGRAVLRTQVPLHERGAAGHALGWMTLRSPRGRAGRVLWHNGGTGGFRSFCATLLPDGPSVAVLAASARPVDWLGQDLLRLLSSG